MSDAEINRAEHAAAIAEFNERAALRYIATLEARLVKLEALLLDIHNNAYPGDGFAARIKAALKDAP